MSELTEDQKLTVARRRFLNLASVVCAIALTAVVVYMLDILALPMSIILWSVIFVFCLRGIVAKLESKGINRVVGTTVAFIVFAIVAALLAFVLFSPVFGLGDQFRNLVESLPGYVKQVTAWAQQMYVQYAEFFANDQVTTWINDFQSAALKWVSDIAPRTAEGFVSTASSIANGFMAIGFALVIAFWILIDLPNLGREVKRLAGPKYADDMEMLHVTLTRVMGGYIKATLIQCAIIAVGCAILFSVLGLPNAAALGGIAGIMNIIPVIGPWIGGGMAGVIGIFVSPMIAAAAVVGTIVIQQLVYTFVSPKVMQDSVDVHPALMFIALFTGSAIGGAMSGMVGSLVGMLAAIPLAAVCKSVFVYYFEKKTRRRLVSTDGVFFKGVPGEGDVVDPMADATSPHPQVAAAAAAKIVYRPRKAADKESPNNDASKAGSGDEVELVKDSNEPAVEEQNK